MDVLSRDQETLWLAGVLEGEGCFTVRGGTRQVRVLVNMTDEDIINRIAKAMDYPATIRCRVRNPRHKPIFHCYALGDKAVDVMKRVLPYMGQRRSGRIIELLEIASKRISRSEAGRMGALARWGARG